MQADWEMLSWQSGGNNGRAKLKQDAQEMIQGAMAGRPDQLSVVVCTTPPPSVCLCSSSIFCVERHCDLNCAISDLLGTVEKVYTFSVDGPKPRSRHPNRHGH